MGLLSSCSIFDSSKKGDEGAQSSQSSSQTNDKVQISISTKSLTIGGGDSELLYVTFNPTTWTYKGIKWSVVGDSSIINIQKKSNTAISVTGLAVGECDIVATYAKDDTIKDTCHVTVSSAYECKNKTVIEQNYSTYNVHNAYGINYCSSKGTPRVLIIPVWFGDSNNFVDQDYREALREDIGKAYLGTSSETGWHSVSSYYETLSSGALHLGGYVAQWYEISATAASYNSNGSDMVTLVNDATDWVFNHTSETRSSFDVNNDGNLDAVLLIYAAPDYSKYEYSVAGKNLWAFQSSTSANPNKANPTANVYFWASYDFMYGPTNTVSRGHSLDSAYANGSDLYPIDSHTFTHEMGHVMGLDDYYDYASATKPAGGFSMQDYNVGSHDPFSVMALGWVNPYIPLGSCTLTLRDFQSTKDIILLTPEWNPTNSVFDEYLLLEFYSPTGLNEADVANQYPGSPQGVNDIGIRLWHVDARLFRITGGYSAPYLGQVTTSTDSTRLVMYNTNTSSGDRVSICEGNNHAFNELQLIRNSYTKTFEDDSFFESADLFKTGDSFSITTYSSQFVNGSESKFNNDKEFKWLFHINSMTATEANITFTLN